MQIFWHGFSCVRIESSAQGKDAVLVTDPYGSDSGLRFPRTLAPDVVALSHQDRKLFVLDNFTNEPFVISDPGEYEIKGIFVYAMPIKHPEKVHLNGLIYRFEIEGMSVGFMGGLERVLSEEEVGDLQNIDILLLPVGGGGALSAKQAREMIGLIEPRMVIPINHQVEGAKAELGTADAFCKELGVCKRQDANKLKIAKKDLPADEMIITVLERA